MRCVIHPKGVGQALNLEERLEDLAGGLVSGAHRWTIRKRGVRGLPGSMWEVLERVNL